MKRIFTFFFALLSACTFSAYAAIVDGTCGDNLTWTLNTKDSTLTISGTGAMRNYYYASAPWYDYRSYIKYVTLPDGLTSIGNVAFMYCSALTSITIPNSVTSIGDEAFLGCSSLTSITIPNSVTSIGVCAFAGCYSLTSVTLGKNLTSIEKGAFDGCNKIQEVTSYASTPPAATSCAWNPTAATLYVPADYIDTYSNTLWWEDFKEIRAIAQYEEGADKEFEVVFSDQDNNELSAQSVTLRVPVAPQIEGFTFLYWQPVAAPLDDVITIQAVYESDSPTEAPEVFVNPSNPAQKLIRNGQVYILQEDKMYTISGQVVK